VLEAWFSPMATMKGIAMAVHSITCAAYVATPNELDRKAMN